MSSLTHLIATLLSVGWVCAQQETQPVDATPYAPSTRLDEVLALAPADALLIAYTTDAGTFFAHPVFGGLPGVPSDLRTALDPLAETFGDAVMVALSGAPNDPLSWQVTLAARIAVDRKELFRRLTEGIIPAWNRSTSAPGLIQFSDDGEFGHLQLVSPVPLSLMLAARNGIVFGSTVPGVVEGWCDASQAPERFVDTDEFLRLSVSRSRPVGALFYVDARPVVPLAAGPLDQMLPKLYDALRLGDVEFLALISGEPMETEEAPEVTPSPESDGRAHPVDPAKPPEPTRPDPVRLAIGLKRIEAGVWHLIASTPSPVSLARFFPDDTTLFVHGSMERASSIADDIAAFASVIDREITNEYEEERSEFERDVGFDPHTGFLGNLVKEWAFGVCGPPFRNPLIAFRLESVDTFKAQMHRLRVFYQLDVCPTLYRGVTIEHAGRKLGPFAYAVVDRVLLVSPEAKAIERAVDALLDDTALARTKAFTGARRRMALPASKFVFLNVAALFAQALESQEAAEYPQLVKLVKDGVGMGVAVVPHERMIALELAASEGRFGRVADVLSMVVVPSLRQARIQAMRAVSLSRVKNIAMSCWVYAEHHKKQWPRSLDQLVASGVLGDPAEARETLLSNPYQRGQDGTGKPYYLYRYIPDPDAVKEKSEEVVLSEPETHDGGAVFGFMDGHAEWVTSPRAEELLAIMRSGQ